MTDTVNQNYNIAQPTDGSAVNNIQPYITGGYGGPHAVFDREHYKSQIRLPEELIEFNAALGALTNIGYVWSINVIKIGDDNVTYSLDWPIVDDTIKNFVADEMGYLINSRFATKFYLPTIDIFINITETSSPYPWS